MENFINFYKTRSARIDKYPISWSTEHGEYNNALNILQLLKKRLELAKMTIVYSKMETEYESELEEFTDFIGDLSQLEEIGIKNKHFQLQSRILKSMDSLIDEERLAKRLPLKDAQIVEAESVMPINKNEAAFTEAEKNKGLLNFEELEAVEKTAGFLHEIWGEPTKEISAKEAIQKIERSRPIDS